MTAALAVAAIVLPVVPAHADKGGGRERHRSERLDHDEILQAQQRGEIKPLPLILEAASTIVPGQIIKVEAKRKDGRFVYEVKMIGDKGRVREVYVDAVTLDIVKVE